MSQKKKYGQYYVYVINKKVTLCLKQKKSDSLSETKKVTPCLKQKSLEMPPTYYEGVSRARMLARGQPSSVCIKKEFEKMS